jgi:hypothetical protein
MDQTLRVDLIIIIGTMPRRTLRIGNQKNKLNKLKSYNPSHCQAIGMKTNHCPT